MGRVADEGKVRIGPRWVLSRSKDRMDKLLGQNVEPAVIKRKIEFMKGELWPWAETDEEFEKQWAEASANPEGWPRIFAQYRTINKFAHKYGFIEEFGLVFEDVEALKEDVDA